jgi:hypothetical protein
MIIKSYIDKCNTIIKDQYTNTGLNPITELLYGGIGIHHKYTRFLFHLDLTHLIDQYNKGNLGDLSQVSHIIEMTNTQAFDADYLRGELTVDDKRRASSFDLVLWKLNQDWDEGNGYDYLCYNILNTNGCTAFKLTNSNWFSAQTSTAWGSPGTYSGVTTGATITTQHFDHGSENLRMDITPYINNIITGGTQYGLALAYRYDYEQTETEELQYVGFFTRHTQTFYEPTLNTSYSGYIKDDRNLFFTDKVNRLYFYTNLGNLPSNLDSNPSVTILDNDGNTFLQIPSSSVTRQYEGVYYVEFLVPSSGYTDCVTFQDIWAGISIDGISRPNKTLEFALKDNDDYYNFGDADGEPRQYAFSISGIKREERIKRGDVKKVLVSARVPYTVDKKQVIDGLKYRVFVKEGTTEVNVIDWEDVNRTNNQNYLLLDTSWMIPETYYLDLKYYSNQQVIQYPEIVKFYIVNQI